MIRSIRRLAKRTAAVSALAAILLTGALALTGSPAAAHAKLNPHPSCPGSQVGHYHRYGGDVTIFVYYSSANGGTNCVWAQKQTRRGTAEHMRLSMFPPADGRASDRGNYKYYVGPVKAGGLAGDCIWIEIYYRGAWRFIDKVHCG